MTLALCICTYKRPVELRTCLDSVFGGDELPDEVIVSDDSPDPAAARGVADDFPGVTFQIGPRRGLGPNRNACLDRATSTHVLFIDDDVVLPRAFMTTARLVGEGATSIVTGRERKHEGGVPVEVTPHNADFLGFQRRPPDGRYTSIVINATVFPRRLFEVARFDENLRYGNEEIDMARHAVALGYGIEYHPALVVDHHPSPANRDEYGRYVDASRLYGTFKSYWRYERSPLKAAVYALIAPVHVMAAGVRHRGMRQLRPAVRSVALAGRYGYLELRRRRRGWPGRRRNDREGGRPCAASSGR